MNPDKTEEEAALHERSAEQYKQAMDKELRIANEKHKRAEAERVRLAQQAAENERRAIEEAAKQQQEEEERINQQQAA